MKTVIATGIYPPQIGGPAQYAKNMKEAFGRKGHHVSVLTYGFEHKLPTGVRHAWFFLRMLRSLPGTGFVLALDTWSVGLPSVLAARLLSKKVVIRTGGDFLWEAYVERTGKKILFRDFYRTEKKNFTFKEKTIFHLTRWTLRHASMVVFSTKWQRDIWQGPYGLDLSRTAIIENYYGEGRSAARATAPGNFTFVGFTRPLVWKNLDTVKEAFRIAKESEPRLELVLDQMPYERATKAISEARGAILASLGDISPNFVLDALRAGTPVILTKENGLDRVGEAVTLVDPLDPRAIAKEILGLCDDAKWKAAAARASSVGFTHTWDDIAGEFLTLLPR